MMNDCAIEEAIQEYIPNVPEEVIVATAEKLRSIGVTDKGDFQYVSEDDISEIRGLTVIQRRKPMANFHEGK